MTLTTIEYGSIASSEVMNENFSYLDGKISDSVSNINTSISSITSNIATINSRITGVSEDVNTDIQELSTKLEEFKAKIQIALNSACLLPIWNSCKELDLSENYQAESNGFILAIPVNNSVGTISINNKTINAKTITNIYDNAAQLMTIPVRKDDVISCTLTLTNAYFVPASTFNIDDIVLDK